MHKTIAFHTLGCKVNFAETSGVEQIFIDEGYTKVSFKELADVYVVNTCAVTQTAVKKSRTIIHQALRMNPHALVVITGCITETEKNDINDFGNNVIIVGANEKFNLFARVEATLNKSKIIEIPVNASEVYFPSYSGNSRTRSFIKIQDGCNYFCSYCVIPHARGRSRSGYTNDILKDIRKIIDNGVQEIVLTGINIGDFRNDKGETLYSFLSELVKIKELKRVRLSSIEPDLLHNNILELFTLYPALLPHFHIPLQSGTDKVLKMMNRRYTTDFYRDKMTAIKTQLPHAFLGTDIITGFPGETDEDFETTRAFVESLPLSAMHVFTYSDRAPAKAAGFSDKLSPQEKKERTTRLLQISEIKKQQFYKSQTSFTRNVLFESSRINNYMYGFTDNYLRVKTKFRKDLVNKIVPVTLNTLDEAMVFVAE